jgi:peroxiredoxin Q/BCP
VVCDFGIMVLADLKSDKHAGISREDILRQEWRKVRVKGHVDEVLDAVRAL